MLQTNVLHLHLKKLNQKKNNSKIMTREILADYLQQNPAEIALEVGEHGKPFIKNNPLHFNVSHSGDYFLMGVTRESAVGVDIECARPNRDFLALAKRFFTPSEFAAIQSDKNPVAAFYRCWTRKEAFIKAAGLGLSFGLSNFEVDVSEDLGTQSCLLHSHNPLFSASDWILRSISSDHLEFSYFAAFATRGNVEPVFCC